MVIDWDGKFILENNEFNSKLNIKEITMMISISNMAMVQRFTMDVDPPLWDSFGILVVLEVHTIVRWINKYIQTEKQY